MLCGRASDTQMKSSQRNVSPDGKRNEMSAVDIIVDRGSTIRPISTSALACWPEVPQNATQAQLNDEV
jgi:hypothetical protein